MDFEDGKVLFKRVVLRSNEQPIHIIKAEQGPFLCATEISNMFPK